MEKHFSDDAFKAYAAQMEKEFEQSQTFLGANSSTGRYEEIFWAGIPKDGPLVVRLRGGFPDKDPACTTARVVNIAEVIGEDKKTHYLYYPSKSVAPDFIMWRIINFILSYTWDPNEKKRVYKYEKEPEYAMVTKNSLQPSDLQYKFEKGWIGQEVLIVNCIPKNPELYEECKRRKHTALLSKNIQEWVNPTTGEIVKFAFKGIPFYGFFPLLVKSIVKFYGDWNNYDLKIMRTGSTTTPYIINNVSRQPELLDSSLLPYVNDKPLSEEEASWEMYDIAKLFKPSSYQKILKTIGRYIKQIDAKYKTTFYPELLELVEEEKKTINEKPVEAPTATRTATPTTREAVASKAYSDAYASLLPQEKEKIVSMKLVDANQNTWAVEYTSAVDPSTLLKCSVCKTCSPADFTTCPGCGRKFEDVPF